jgi:hypothetical protein
MQMEMIGLVGAGSRPLVPSAYRRSVVNLSDPVRLVAFLIYKDRRTDKMELISEI